MSKKISDTAAKGVKKAADKILDTLGSFDGNVDKESPEYKKGKEQGEKVKERKEYSFDLNEFLKKFNSNFNKQGNTPEQNKALLDEYVARRAEAKQKHPDLYRAFFLKDDAENLTPKDLLAIGKGPVKANAKITSATTAKEFLTSPKNANQHKVKDVAAESKEYRTNQLSEKDKKYFDDKSKKDSDTYYFSNQIISGVSDYIEKQGQGATEDTLSRKMGGITDSVNALKHVNPEFYKENKGYFDNLIATTSKDYQTYERPFGEAMSNFVKGYKSGEGKEKLDGYRVDAVNALNKMKSEKWGLYRKNAPYYFLTIAETMSPEEIAEKKESWVKEFYTAIAPSEQLQKSAPNDASMLADLNTAKQARDEFAYEIDRAYERAVFAKEYGKKWRGATIEKDDGSIDGSKIPSKDVLKAIAFTEAKRDEDSLKRLETASSLPGDARTFDVTSGNTLSNRINNGEFDSNKAITKTKDGTYILFGIDDYKYTAKEIAQMAEMYKNGGADKLGMYINTFVLPRRNKELSEKVFNYFDSIAQNGNVFEKAGATALSFVGSKAVSIPAAVESLVANTEGAITGVTPNKDYGMFSSFKKGADSGRQFVGGSLYTDVTKAFTSDDEKAAEFGAKLFTYVDSATNSISNILMGIPGVAVMASESAYSTLDEGIQQGKNPKKTLAKTAVLTPLEFVTELIQFKGIENMLAISKVEKNLAKKIFKGAAFGYANELPGELVSSYAGEAVDYWLYGNDSNFTRAIDERIASGKSKNRALATMDYLGEIGLDTAASVLITSVFLGGGTLIADPKNKTAKTYEDFGKRFRDGEINVPLLIEQSIRSSNPVTQTIAKNAGLEGEKLTDSQLGLLYFSAKGDFVNGKLNTTEFARGKMFEERAKKIKESGNTEAFIQFAMGLENPAVNMVATVADTVYKNKNDIPDAELGELYGIVAESVYVDAEKFITKQEQNEAYNAGETDTVTNDSIGDALKNAVEEAGKAVKLANAKPVEKDVITVKTSDGNTVSAKGEYFAKLGGDKIYTVKGSDIGLDNGFYAVNSRTGDNIASGETKSVLYNAVKEIKKNYTDVAITNDASVAEDVNEVVGESEVKSSPATDKASSDVKSNSTQKITRRYKDKLVHSEGVKVDTDLGYELYAVENNIGGKKTISIVEKSSGLEFGSGNTIDEAVSDATAKIENYGNEKIEQIIRDKKIGGSVAKSTISMTEAVKGDALTVGKAVSEADYTNEVLTRAKESNNKALQQAAQKYSDYDFKNEEQRYRAIGNMAKKLGITAESLVRSRAKSLFRRFATSISGGDSVIQRVINGISTEIATAKARGDNSTLEALEYLGNVIKGENSAVSVADMFESNEFSNDNRNYAVEVYTKSMERAFKASGVDVSISVYYDNSDDAVRGDWSTKDGKSVISLNGAMLSGEQSAFWVLSHELFHEAESKAPGIAQRVLKVFFEMGIYNEKQYEAYRERYQGHENAIAESEGRKPRTLSKEYIEGEIAADLMSETMGSTELLEMFAGKLNDNDASVILSFLKKIASGIKKVFNSKDAFVNEFDKVVKDFEGAIKGKVDGKDSAEKTADTNTKKALAEIDAERITSNELDTRYSLTHNDDIAKGELEYIRNNKSSITEAELKDAQEVTRAMVDVMMKYSEILPEDKIGKVLTKNGSYDRSVENTTICVRTLAYNEFVDKVQEELGRPLTQMESFLVSQKMYDIATDPQCLYCYVSLDRKAFNDMLLRYMQDRDTVIAKYNDSNKSPEAVAEIYEEFLRGRKDTKEMKARFNGWLDLVDNGTQLLSLADIATEDRQRTITADGGNLAQQLKDARKYAQTASWAKIQKDYVAYRDEILKLGDKVVKNLNEHYGLRWYSFSDYSAAFIVENMQQITDASIRGLKGLAYTKDTDFVEIFASTGMNINISVFVNQDKDGNFFIDEKQSANFEKAVELRKKYPNVGIVATVTNDEAMAWAGKQEWSDVIIPFHIVRTGTDVAEYYNWLNYTNESGDTIADKNLWEAYVNSLNLSSENARKKVSKNIYPSEHKNDKDTYLSLCESRGLSPRFARFIGEDWYMKLVNETRLSADEFSALKPEFNLKAAKESFQKFIDKGGYKGSWYKEGVDVESEAKAVAEDVRAGKKANEVEYGRQDGYNPEEIAANRKKNRGHEGDKKYAFQGKNNAKKAYYDYAKNDFAKQVDDYLNPNPKLRKMPPNDSFLIGGTPQILRDIGFNALPMTINKTHIDYALNGSKDFDHEIFIDVLKKIPKAIENPVMVMESDSVKGRAVIVLKITAKNGKKLYLPVEIDGQASLNGIRINSNAIVSSFGKNNVEVKINNALNREAQGNTSVFYWNKKEALSLLQRSGLQLSTQLPQDGFVHSIRENDAFVNYRSIFITEFQLFRKIFCYMFYILNTF